MGLLRALRGGQLEQRDGFGELAARIPMPMEAARSLAGPLVNDGTSLLHIDVYKCRSLIADSVAMLPLHAYRTRAYTDTASGAVRTFKEKVPTQPQILVDPCPNDLTPTWNLKHVIMDSLLGDGNAYLEICAVDQLGYPTVVCPIDPIKVRDIYLDEAGHICYEMHDGCVLGNVRSGGTMIHIRGYTRAGTLKGLSPIMAGKQGIALSMAAEEFGSRFFGDGANPSGYLKTEGVIDEDQAKALKRKWLQTYGGLNREPAVLYGGMEWHPISISPEESQFIETRKFQSGQIAALFRIPPHLVGDIDKTTSWGSGIEEMGQGFVTFTLGAWLARIEQAFSFLLPRGQVAKFETDELLRGKALDQAEMLTKYKQWGILSTNDIRHKLHEPPIPDGDIYLQPLNMVDAAKAMDVLAPEPPPAPAPQMTDGPNAPA